MQIFRVALVGGSEENKVCKKDRGLSRIQEPGVHMGVKLAAFIRIDLVCRWRRRILALSKSFEFIAPLNEKTGRQNIMCTPPFASIDSRSRKYCLREIELVEIRSSSRWFLVDTAVGITAVGLKGYYGYLHSKWVFWCCH